MSICELEMMCLLGVKLLVAGYLQVIKWLVTDYTYWARNSPQLRYFFSIVLEEKAHVSWKEVKSCIKCRLVGFPTFSLGSSSAYHSWKDFCPVKVYLLHNVTENVIYWHAHVIVAGELVFKASTRLNNILISEMVCESVRVLQFIHEINVSQSFKFIH